jgi:hypothetical protein
MYSTEKYYRKLYTATQSPLIKMKINRMEKFHADLVRFCLNLTHDLYWEDDITGELTGIPLNRALYRALNICDMVKALYDEAVDEEFEIPQNIKDTIGDITMA